MKIPKSLTVSWQTKSFVNGSKYLFLVGFISLSAFLCIGSTRVVIEIFSKGVIHAHWIELLSAVMLLVGSLFFGVHAASIVLRNENRHTVEADRVVFKPQHFDFVRCFSNQPPGKGGNSLGFNQAFRTFRTNVEDFMVSSVNKKSLAIQLNFGGHRLLFEHFLSGNDFESVLNTCYQVKKDLAGK